MNIAPALTATFRPTETTEMDFKIYDGKKVSVIEAIDPQHPLYGYGDAGPMYSVQVHNSGEEFDALGDELEFDVIEYRGYRISTDGEGVNETFTVTDENDNEFMSGLESFAVARAAVDAEISR